MLLSDVLSTHIALKSKVIQVYTPLGEVNGKNNFFNLNSSKHGTHFVVIYLCCSQSWAKLSHEYCCRICLFSVMCIASWWLLYCCMSFFSLCAYEATNPKARLFCQYCYWRITKQTTGHYLKPQVLICKHRSLSATTGLYQQTGLDQQTGPYLKKGLSTTNTVTTGCSNLSKMCQIYEQCS